MRFPAVLVATLVIAACTSVNELRSSSPVQSADFAKDYRVVTDCLSDRLSATYEVATTAQLSERSATISYILGSPDIRVPAWEITVRETAVGRTGAELRSVETVWGTPYAEPDVWAAVERCGAS